MEKFLGFVIGVIVLVSAFLVAFALSMLVNGYVLLVLWGWFAVPLGASTLSMLELLGLSLLIGVFTSEPNSIKSEFKTDAMTTTITNLVIRPIVILTVGWLIQFLMATYGA